METIVIVLCILSGVSVLSLGIVACLQIVTTSRERIELQRLLKAKDLPEFVQYAQQEDEVEEEDQNLVDLENIGTVIAEKLEEKSKLQ